MSTSSASPSIRTIGRLVAKDIFLHRRLTIGSLVAGFVALALLASRGELTFYLGGVLLVTVLIGHGATLAILSVIEEHQQRTLPFVMSLPVSAPQVAASKILANLSIFGVVWSVLLAGTLTLILRRDDLPDGLLVYALIVALEIFASTCLVFLVAVATRSLPWTIGTMICGNLMFNGFVFYLLRTPAFAAATESSGVAWPATAQAVLLVELASILLLLTLAFLISLRRKDVL